VGRPNGQAQFLFPNCVGKTRRFLEEGTAIHCSYRCTPHHSAEGLGTGCDRHHTKDQTEPIKGAVACPRLASLSCNADAANNPMARGATIPLLESGSTPPSASIFKL
jgi:hypothetical protein